MASLALAGERGRDEKVDQRDVEARIISEVNRLAKLGLFESMKLDYKTVGSCYITTFRNVPVLIDDDMDLAYCELPASFIELPYGKGIDYIGPMIARNKEFIPTTNHHSFASDYSPAAALQSMVGYWIELGPNGQRAYFTRDILNKDEIENLLIRLVIVDASVINRSAPLQMDPATEADIWDRVYTAFAPQNQSPKDVTNNSISDKRP